MNLGLIEELLIFVKKIMFCLIGLVVAITGWMSNCSNNNDSI